ncbi:putative methyltransferase C9orf114 homolog isoform X1 [Sesamum indicum]|uniref:Methyltransferase C9orf114 homolog isoform X1 n=1 Tax=Sesamum indicum TaxID=4182 RepID=A0A6I9SVR8_SESIN|nr:putative methyltransferase C9orf114 homolog isoform X1 [Sesamum indicum]
MGKKEKRKMEQNDVSAANGGSEYQEKHRKKKRKNREKVEEPQNEAVLATDIPTVTIAVPGSIIDNAQSLELATRLAGQLARAATIFRIDELSIVDFCASLDKCRSPQCRNKDAGENESGAPFLIRILKYLETPQYLRKSLFPKHNSLRFVGLLPPLDAPHHLRKHEWASYREGITREKLDRGSGGTLVDVGLSKNVMIDEVLEPGIRVTVEMGTNRNLDAGPPRKVVPSSRPREEGMYWGYKVRYASNISSVFKNCPYQGGYDHRIGTSEHGSVFNSSELTLPSFRHLLIAFGGLAGLEECVEEDENLKGKNVRDIFDSYLNTCPHQGSRTIRTEEAMFISLQYFQEPISRVSQKYEYSNR